MDYMLQNGEIQLDSTGKPIQLQGTAELKQRVLIRLTVRRGSLKAMPELGSRLYRLSSGAMQLENQAAAMIREALYTMPEVTVLSVKAESLQKDGVELCITLLIQGQEEKLYLQIAGG